MAAPSTTRLTWSSSKNLLLTRGRLLRVQRLCILAFSWSKSFVGLVRGRLSSAGSHSRPFQGQNLSCSESNRGANLWVVARQGSRQPQNKGWGVEEVRPSSAAGRHGGRRKRLTFLRRRQRLWATPKRRPGRSPSPCRTRTRGCQPRCSPNPATRRLSRTPDRACRTTSGLSTYASV